MKKLLALLLFCSSTVLAAGTATLQWDYLPADVIAFGLTGFPLERKPGPCAVAGVFAEIAVIAPILRTYTDPSLTNGSTYCWRIAAQNSTGKSGYSNTVEKLIPFAVPPAPGNLSVVITISLNPDTGKYQLVIN